MEKANKIRELITDFESGKISSDYALSEINKYSNQSVDIDWLYSYQSSIDLDMFIRILTIEPIVDWQDIDDKRAIILLEEIMSNLGDDALLQRDFEALEKRYSKPTGRISNWIFHEDINDTTELLKLLKTNTSIAF